MKLTGAQIIVEALIDQGCDTVFGYPAVRCSIFMMSFIKIRTG